MSETGYAVFFYGALEFSINPMSEEDAENCDASRWFRTFSEAKAWSVDEVKHTAESYRKLLKNVRALRKHHVTPPQPNPIKQEE